MRTLTVADREQVLALARSQVGVSENPPYSNNVEYSRWYGLQGPWCAMFVSWCFYQTLGFSPFPATTSKGFAYCPSGVQWFKDHGMWARRGVTPEPGWIVFYDFGMGRASHVGIVQAPVGDRDHTVEGNTNGAGSRTGGSVMEHHRSRGQVVGYGTLKYVPATVPSKPVVVIPPTPQLTQTLRPGIADDKTLSDADQFIAVLAVRWVHERLSVIMPRLGYQGPELRMDARFDDATTIAVVYFKSWCNAVARLQGNPEPFPVVNGLVGTKTIAHLAWWGAHFQTNPA